MSIRSFKQAFSIVFAFVLGGIGLAFGLNLRSFVPRRRDTDLMEIINNLLDQPLYVNSTATALCIVGLLLGVILGPKAAQRLIRVGDAVERMSAADKIAVESALFWELSVPSRSTCSYCGGPSSGSPSLFSSR